MKRKALISAVALVAVLGGSMTAVAAGGQKNDARMGGNGPSFERGFGGQGMGAGGPQFVFAEVDTDGDGKISTEEFDAYKAAQFAKVDADGNGTVSVEELIAFDETQRVERQKFRVEAMVKARDTDGDGVLSAEELSTQPQKSPFERLDRNDDGFISEDELQAWPRMGQNGADGRMHGKHARGKGDCVMGQGQRMGQGQPVPPQPTEGADNN